VKAIDPRLWRWGRPVRTYVATAVGLGSFRALLLVAQAWLIASIVAGAFISGDGLVAERRPMAELLVVVLLRALVTWYTEASAARCSAKVKSTMRAALVQRAARLGPMGQPVSGAGSLATLAVGGIDALDAYFAHYLPQVLLSVIVPLTVLAAVSSQDWISAVIILVTLPLIPIFMVLIGLETRSRNDRQLRELQRLSGHFLDVVRGLTTLKVFGRSTAQIGVIREVTGRYRKRLMSTLRVTFLSSLALELLGSVSVALIAVAVGLRLLGGHLELRPALFVLILAPEAYLPLRQLGADFHASAEGLSAAQQVFDLLEQPTVAPGTSTVVPDPATAGLTICALRVRYPGQDRPVIDGLTLSVSPGEILAITGESGCGKSTLLAVLLLFARPESGAVQVGGVDLSTIDPDVWRRRIAWVPQRPHLVAGTVADNIRLGDADASTPDVERAAAKAGLSDLLRRLPRGLDTSLGEDGAGLSGGERQRVALARAFLRNAPLVLLDEPTANLDGETEAKVLSAVERLARGRTVVLVAHRPALVALAERVIDLSHAESMA
jgi:thiol reductant ABC exporter CydD subunit